MPFDTKLQVGRVPITRLQLAGRELPPMWFQPRVITVGRLDNNP